MGKLRFDIAEQPLAYAGHNEFLPFGSGQIVDFNHTHAAVLELFELELVAASTLELPERRNDRSNLGALRNRQLREAVLLAAALPAIGVGLAGRGSLLAVPRDQVTPAVVNRLKRANDRTAAQIMSEVLQLTTDSLPSGEEVLIESAITEGARAKPGKEPGGNPTIPVGALFGKAPHRAQYGLPMSKSVTPLSMGSDVIDGTTKSVKGQHSSLTSLFVTEANVKRHLPDVYVQRWMAGARFPRFNPRETGLHEAAEIIATAYGTRDLRSLSAFFLDRPRHHPAMDALNELGVCTPFDQDGDLMPAVVLGMDCLRFGDDRQLSSMIGEIGGSAEWAVAVLPLVWRGGQALGMLTSQTALTRKGLSDEELWRERFHFTEDEFIVIQDARFERKPYFTIDDILDDPHAGGVSAFGAITDNAYVPFLQGVRIDADRGQIVAAVLVVDSLGTSRCWRLHFACQAELASTVRRMTSPKSAVEGLRGTTLERQIGRMLEDATLRQRFRIFFTNEYYPALVPVHDKMVVLHKVIGGLLERGAIDAADVDIVRATEQVAGSDWFVRG